MGAAIISVVNAPPVLDFGEQVFDQVPLFLDRFVVVVLDLAVVFLAGCGA